MNVKDDFEDFTFLCLNSRGVSVLIVGGGNAAFIKVKSFLKKGFVVHCISPQFNEEIVNLSYENLKLIKDEFYEELIHSYHLIIICTDNEELNKYIRELCDKNYKICIDTTIPEESMATLCAMTSTKEVSIGVRIKGKSPKTSQLLANKIKNYICTYDDYVYFVTRLRKNIKDFPRRLEILDFVSSEDFLFFFQKNYGEKVLNLFYGGDDLEF